MNIIYIPKLADTSSMHLKRGGVLIHYWLGEFTCNDRRPSVVRRSSAGFVRSASVIFPTTVHTVESETFIAAGISNSTVGVLGNAFLITPSENSVA